MNKIVWIDVETTGVKKSSELLQIACITTDQNFNILDEYNWIVKQDSAAMKAISDDYVREMHSITGLWDRLETEGIPLEEIDEKLSQILEDNSDGRLVSIGGNSVHFDNGFIKSKMPKSGKLTSHRVLDMSAVLMFMTIIGEKVALPYHKTTHDALDDIRRSIDQARYTRLRIKRL